MFLSTFKYLAIHLSFSDFAAKVSTGNNSQNSPLTRSAIELSRRKMGLTSQLTLGHFRFRNGRLILTYRGDKRGVEGIIRKPEK